MTTPADANSPHPSDPLEPTLSELVAEEEIRHDPYAAIREPNYRLFAGGWMLASTGMQMQGAAVLWEIYEKTHDPLLVGSAGLARALPVVVLALPAGQIIDMVDRKRVLIATQFAFALASLALAAASFADANIVWLYLLLVITGCARVFNGPSRSSLLPQIVRKEHFHNAITWNSGLFHLSAGAGPLIAGGLIAWTGGAAAVYASTCAMCLAFGAMAMFIRPYEGHVAHASARSIWSVARPGVLLPGILEGVRHVRREKTVLAALALDLLAVLFGGATALVPIYAKDILHVGPVGYGALRSAQYIGALLMAVVLAHRKPFSRSGWTLLGAVAGFGACTIVFGLSRNFLLSYAALFSLGALDSISVVIRHVLVTVRTPDNLRGRVSAVNSVFIESSNEVGNFESGLVAKAFGPVVSAVSGGVGTILVVAAVALAWPELRRLRRLDPK